MGHDRARDEGEERPPEQRSAGGFLESDNVWILIPILALSIPIVAVAGETPLVWVIGAVAVIGAVTAALRHLTILRHRLRLEELAAQERLSRAERERFAAIDRLVDTDRLGDHLHVDQPRSEDPPAR